MNTQLSQKLKEVNQHLEIIHEILNDETPVDKPSHFQIGIDLGTADIQSIVVDQNGEPIAAFLDWADVVKDGVVVDYFGACQIVRKHIEKIETKLGIKVQEAVTSFPPGTDSRISINVVEAAGINVAKVIDEPASVAHLLNIEEGAVVDVGGGTTGTAIIEIGKLQASYDEASGGHHVSLTIAGGLKISLEEAEMLKRDPKERVMIGNMVRPVLENMAYIVKKHLQDYQPKALYLTGGGCLIHGFADVFKKVFPELEIVEFKHALYLTPLAIASYQL